ncbi:hypothetical protein L1987_48053 [Smallanthus sonchifolius]|uniref:Uncharacterized protein n=1 Tax=Smallanthus sonchifolius TaxID=185202 RepID=A0ACB9FRT9_9ASTR|nr:hypothetical protein L1987_48053 [Smallanthus sonchifolius]
MFLVAKENETTLPQARFFIIHYHFFYLRLRCILWRIKATEVAGGWKDRTTVEDMDLAVRASLKGWELVFVGGLKEKYTITWVKNELPSKFKAYPYQHHGHVGLLICSEKCKRNHLL